MTRPILATMLKAEPGEVRPVLWAAAYFFCLLCSYYILRPVRDEMAIEGGVQHLPWLMTTTFLTMLALTPLFGHLATRLPRRFLLMTVYGFFATNVLGFFVLMTMQTEPAWTARTFYVWLSVFNLFVVSVFWSFMADLFTSEQGKRLFGVIAAGGSAGALAGPALTTGLTYVTGIPPLLLVSAGFLVLCVVCIYHLERWAIDRAPSRFLRDEQAIGGSIWAGIQLAVSSPYLLGICLYLFLLTATTTFMYLEITRLVGEQLFDPAVRTRFFARIDLTVNGLALLTQLFITNRLIQRFGLLTALLFLPIVSLIGFGWIGMAPALTLFVGLGVIRRAGEYAISKPAREILFTVVSREEKYKAKNFIDTAVTRGGDALSGWLVTAIKAAGVSTSHLAWLLLPVAVGWSCLSWFLSREHEQLRARAAHSTKRGG